MLVVFLTLYFLFDCSLKHTLYPFKFKHFDAFPLDLFPQKSDNGCIFIYFFVFLFTHFFGHFVIMRTTIRDDAVPCMRIYKGRYTRDDKSIYRRQLRNHRAAHSSAASEPNGFGTDFDSLRRTSQRIRTAEGWVYGFPEISGTETIEAAPLVANVSASPAIPAAVKR